MGNNANRRAGDAAARQAVSFERNDVLATATAEAQQELPIDEVLVGDRHRRGLGDVDTLAATIADIGPLHPVVVTRKRVLAPQRGCPLDVLRRALLRDATPLGVALDLVAGERR